MQKGFIEMQQPEREYMLAKIQEQEAIIRELVAACEAVMVWCTDNDEWVNGADLPTLAEIVVPQVEAAIARAKGEEAK